jgi:hypothetical protein
MLLRRAAPLLLILLTGCASAASGDYPALGKRAIESQFDVIATAPPPAPGPLPVDLAERLAAWRSRAAGADAAFAAALPPATAAVTAAAGAPVASESWIIAQQALSRLAVARGALTDGLADVDALYLARLRDDAVDGLPMIAALRAEMTTMQAAQDAALAALAARMSQ